MPTADATLITPAAPPQARFVVRTSILMELVWAMLIKDDEPSPDFPARGDRFASDPGLFERIRTFWADGEGCFTEAFVAADRGGALFENDPDRLWAGLAAGLTGPPRFEALVSETPEDRARFRARLARLHAEPDLRAGWLALLQDSWAALAAGWQGEGRQVAESLVWAVRDKVPEAGSYADLVSIAQGCDFGGLLPRLVGEATAAGQEVALLPTWMGRNSFVVSLPDRLLWGPPAPVRPSGPSAETRERARRHKALGDPTRLAIFEAAAHRARTVGELARELGVAQPTVSNHVRILRDAGLLDQEKGGGRRLAPDLDRFHRLLEDSRRAVTPPGPDITALD
ncbi:MAG TPA: winged helix-turn-helix domain-containing protein [Acidimicrobiales bacterium]|jgi:DNA-binding transcriptional ArsR family regulator